VEAIALHPPVLEGLGQFIQAQGLDISLLRHSLVLPAFARGVNVDNLLKI
jgi:hypothetical protein